MWGYSMKTMKTFFSQSLFFVLYFLLVGIVSQDILVAMNLSGKSKKTSRSLFAEFDTHKDSIDEKQAQKICLDVLDRVNKKLSKQSKKIDKKKIKARQLQIST